VRILIVTQYFWPESFRINDLALGMRDRGHDVTVLTGLPNYPDGNLYPGYSLLSRRETYDGIRIKRVPLIPRGNSNGPRLLANYASFAALASVLGPFRCRQEYDIVLTFQASPVTVALPAMIMKWRRHVPMLMWVQDLWPESLSATGAVKSPWVLKQVDRFVRQAYRQSARVLVQSEGFISHVESRGVSRDRIDYMPNWAEDFFRPVTLADDAPEHAEMPPGFRILFAGNIGKGQAFDTILAAAEKTRTRPDIQWVVLGDGRDRERVAAEIERRELTATVHLLGRRPVESMPWYYAAADALLITLTKAPIFAMTIPSKVQSCLASGKPILAALDGEGARVVAESKAGLVGPAEDADRLARHAVALADMSVTDRDTMGRRARSFYEEQFDRGLVLDRFETIMHDVTGDSQRCAA